jgi:hypothetical protein
MFTALLPVDNGVLEIDTRRDRTPYFLLDFVEED